MQCILCVTQSSGEEILKVVDLNLEDKVKGVSFEVKQGEILGIAGLVGSGRSETARAVFAADKPKSGTIFLDWKRAKTPVTG